MSAPEIQQHLQTRKAAMHLPLEWYGVFVKLQWGISFGCFTNQHLIITRQNQSPASGMIRN
jgi:hypothetical protein